MEDPRDSIGRLGNRVTPSKNLGQFSLKTRGTTLREHLRPDLPFMFVHVFVSSFGSLGSQHSKVVSRCHWWNCCPWFLHLGFDLPWHAIGPWFFRPSSGTRNGAQAHSADQVQPCTTMYNQQNWALGRARLPIWAANSCKLLTLNPIMDSSRGIMGIGIKPY